MVTEAIISLIVLTLGFVGGRLSKQHDCSPSWVDGWSSGYLAAMDDQDAVRPHREGDRYDA